MHNRQRRLKHLRGRPLLQSLLRAAPSPSPERNWGRRYDTEWGARVRVRVHSSCCSQTCSSAPAWKDTDGASAPGSDSSPQAACVLSPLPFPGCIPPSWPPGTLCPAGTRASVFLEESGRSSFWSPRPPTPHSPCAALSLLFAALPAGMHLSHPERTRSPDSGGRGRVESSHLPRRVAAPSTRGRRGHLRLYRPRVLPLRHGFRDHCRKTGEASATQRALLQAASLCWI